MILRTAARGKRRTKNAGTWLRKPVMATTVPRRKARWLMRATDAADMECFFTNPRVFILAAAPKFVAVGPGQEAVTVTPVSASYSARASLKDNT